MSMPSFPPNGADMTREEALTMIIASIAMEELALSHILNAEGEKLQYILGTLPGSNPCTCSQDVLAVNKSVTALVEAVTQNQMLLKNKLAQVLEFCPPPPPPPACKPEPVPAPCLPPPCFPKCPPPRPAPRPASCCEKSAVQLTGQQERMLWNPNCRLPWKLRSRCGTGIYWDGRTPAQIRLSPGKTYAVQYTLNICAIPPAAEAGRLCLMQTPCGLFSDTPPLHFSLANLTHNPQSLHYVSVLHPCVAEGCKVELSLVLESKRPLLVERVLMDIIEL